MRSVLTRIPTLTSDEFAIDTNVAIEFLNTPEMAPALQYRLPFLTRDAHFQNVEGLTVVPW